MAVADEDVERALQVMGAKNAESVRDFLKNLDSLEVEEKNGHKMLRAQSGDTEYFCIQAQNKLILAIRDEDTFSYFAQTEDGKLMQVSGENFSLNDDGKKLSIKADGEDEKIEIDVQKRNNGTIKSSTLNVTGKETETDENSGEEINPTLSVKAKYDRHGNLVSVTAADRIYMEDLGSRVIDISFGENDTIKEISHKGMNSEGDIVDIKIKDGKITDGIVINDNGVWRYTDGQKEFLGRDIGMADEIEANYQEAQNDYKEALKKEFEGGYVLSEVINEKGEKEYYRSDDSHEEPYKISKEEYETGLTYNFIEKRDDADYFKEKYEKLQQSAVIEVGGYKVAYTPVSQMNPEEVKACIDDEMYVDEEMHNDNHSQKQLKDDLSAQASEGGQLPDNVKARSQAIRIDQHYEERKTKTAENSTGLHQDNSQEIDVSYMASRSVER